LVGEGRLYGFDAKAEAGDIAAETEHLAAVLDGLVGVLSVGSDGPPRSKIVGPARRRMPASLVRRLYRRAALDGEELKAGASLSRAVALGLLFLEPVKDFFAVDGDFGGAGESQPHAIAADVDHGQNDVVADDDPFTLVSTEHQHEQSSLK
jgi:hypothetical protein